jgi:hypothetical protein
MKYANFSANPISRVCGTLVEERIGEYWSAEMEKIKQ